MRRDRDRQTDRQNTQRERKSVRKCQQKEMKRKSLPAWGEGWRLGGGGGGGGGEGGGGMEEEGGERRRILIRVNCGSTIQSLTALQQSLATG